MEVALEAVTESEAITERRLDPESRVAISTDTQDRASTSSDSAGGAVTVASNLPTGTAGAGDGQSQSNNSETRERTNFEVSETKRELLRAPGAIRRLTVAVLVDGVASQAADGTETKSPRSDEELAALRDLVAAAVGYDEKRGDIITVKSMSFEPAIAGDPPAPSWLQAMPIDLMSLIQVAVLALVSLVIGLFVLRPILIGRPAPRQGLPAPAPDSAARVLTGTIEDDDGASPALPVPAGDRNRTAATLAADAADPVARLRQLIAERQDETVDILRGWMEESGEKTA